MLNGATAASFSTANAYVADISTAETRARNFGWMSAAFSVGFLLGPAAGGVLATVSVHIGSFHMDPLRTPFLAAAGLCAINWVYGLFVLPESLAPERRIVSFEWRRANPVASLSLLRSHRELLGLAGPRRGRRGRLVAPQVEAQVDRQRLLHHQDQQEQQVQPRRLRKP